MSDTRFRPRDADMDGWLLKWTNYIKGYQRRWFVLSNGLLSYYRYVNVTAVSIVSLLTHLS